MSCDCLQLHSNEVHITGLCCCTATQSSSKISPAMDNESPFRKSVGKGRLTELKGASSSTLGLCKCLFKCFNDIRVCCPQWAFLVDSSQSIPDHLDIDGARWCLRLLDVGIKECQRYTACISAVDIRNQGSSFAELAEEIDRFDPVFRVLPKKVNEGQRGFLSLRWQRAELWIERAETVECERLGVSVTAKNDQHAADFVCVCHSLIEDHLSLLLGWVGSLDTSSVPLVVRREFSCNMVTGAWCNRCRLSGAMVEGKV